jgi:hypothetical protein
MLIGRALTAVSHPRDQRGYRHRLLQDRRIADGRPARRDGNHGQSVRTASERATVAVRAVFCQVAFRTASTEKT